jgi:hypothetical protein
MSATLDDNGRPYRAFDAQLRAHREIAEMLEICRGILVVGQIDEAEARAFAVWARHHPELAGRWPASVVARRLASLFIDGTVARDEWEELLALLEIAKGTAPLSASDAELASYLGLDDPPPPIVVPGKRFCFTGRFFFGTRRVCEAIVIDGGGEVLDAVRRDLDYLVIGLLGSRNWIHAMHGVKIQKAIEYRERGAGIAIVSEKHWAAQLVPVTN